MSIDTSGALPNGAQPVTGGAMLRAAIAAAFNEYLPDADAATDARQLAKAANEAGLSRKELVISAAAQHANAGKWDSEEVASAVKTEIKARKEAGAKSPAALTQFGSELRRFLAPAVRPYVATFFAIARDAVDNETAMKAIDGDASTPVTKAFSKAYHAAFNLAKHVSEKHNGADFTTAADVQMFAIAYLRAREINVDRVLKRLAKLTDELKAFNADFDLDALHDCAEAMSNIRKEDIEGALIVRPVATAADIDALNERIDAGNAARAAATAPTPAPAADDSDSDYERMMSDTIAQAA